MLVAGRDRLRPISRRNELGKVVGRFEHRRDIDGGQAFELGSIVPEHIARRLVHVFDGSRLRIDDVDGVVRGIDERTEEFEFPLVLDPVCNISLNCDVRDRLTLLEDRRDDLVCPIDLAVLPPVWHFLVEHLTPLDRFP